MGAIVPPEEDDRVAFGAFGRGRIRVVEPVVETNAARRILEGLGVPVDAPQQARARDPTSLHGAKPDAS